MSTTYYALFHELSWRGTRALLDEPVGWSERSAAVSRWVTHSRVLLLSQAVLGSAGHPALQQLLTARPPDLLRIADTLVRAQQARERADYDDFYDLNRALAMSLTASVREAVGLCDRLARQQDPTFALFLRLMLAAGEAKTRK